MSILTVGWLVICDRESRFMTKTDESSVMTTSIEINFDNPGYNILFPRHNED